MPVGCQQAVLTRGISRAARQAACSDSLAWQLRCFLLSLQSEVLHVGSLADESPLRGEIGHGQ
jgi:hypothetical protein